MKSEHRHDLQTNELGKIAERLTAFLEVHGNRLMIGVCVVSLLASAMIYWVRTRRNNEAAAWRELAGAVAANRADDFYDVWNGNQGTTVGQWARVHEGETRLANGVEQLFSNLDLGTEEVKKARAAFQAVVDERRSPREVRERGLLGLGRALESLSEPAEAVKVYETLVKEFKDSIYKNDAQERIDVLKKSGPEFYAWFTKFDRPKPIEKSPHDPFGDETSEEQNADLENADLEKFHKSGSKSAADEGESPTLPDTDKPAKEPKETSPSKAEQPDSEGDGDAGPGSKSESEPKSEPDNGEKPEPESKPDES
jgi:hypothetical protein